MIQQQTVLKASDNSGAKSVKCIKVLGSFRKKTAKLGDVIIVSVQELRNKSKKTSKVKKGHVCKALVIKTRTKLKSKDGSSLSFNNNSVSLMNSQSKPLATRIIGPVPKKFKKGKFAKFANISFGTVFS
jgi:large subunit ribosomal protein L14